MSLATDGIPTDAEMDATTARAEELFFEEIFTEIAGDRDPSGFAYYLFVQLVRFLAEDGWDPKQLGDDATWHAHHQTTEGRA